MKQYTQNKVECKALNAVFNRFNVFDKSYGTSEFNDFYGFNEIKILLDFYKINGFYGLVGFNKSNESNEFNRFKDRSVN